MSPPPPARTRVAVVFGGRSSEHAISCISAGNVISALDPAVYDVVPVGITRDGAWVLASGDPAELTAHGRELPSVGAGAAVALPGDPTAGGLVALSAGAATEALGTVDVVIPMLHGAYGEDGTIQGLLEMAGIDYVGAGVLASAAAMDKEFTKKLLAAEGIEVGTYAVLRPGVQTLSGAEMDRLGLPAFVKPARAGSSQGISRIMSWSELPAAVDLARTIDPKVLIEAGVSGREVECGVLEGVDGRGPDASLPAEIRLVSPEHDWYDFEAKYLDDACEVDIPAKLSDDVTARLRETACRAFDALSCAGLARVDFFVVDDEQLVVNEVNTMPGFTPISQFAAMWAATGIDLPDLLDRMIRTAQARGTGLR